MSDFSTWVANSGVLLGRIQTLREFTAEAGRRFGMPMLFGYLNFVHDGYNTHGCYTGTHDLDYMRYTREGVMLYAQRIVAEIFAYVFDDDQSMYDDPDFSEERVAKAWNDFEYFAKYAPPELAR